MKKAQIIRHWRKVRAPGERLLWRHSNPRSQFIDSRDIAVIRNGTLTAHFYTRVALEQEIREREEGEKR